MNTDAYRDLQLLTEIAAGDAVTQRRLAQKHGLALGLTNFLIRRLVKKGYVKIINLERKRLRYLLTPNGIAEKARLTYEYLEYSLHLYRNIRTLVTRTLSALSASGRKDIVLYGTGEMAEIAFGLMQQHGLPVVAVVDEPLNGAMTFMNRPVRPLSDVASIPFDWILIASFQDNRKIIRQLSQCGVPEEKIITISEEGHTPALRRARARAILEAPETLVMEARR